MMDPYTLTRDATSRSLYDYQELYIHISISIHHWDDIWSVLRVYWFILDPCRRLKCYFWINIADTEIAS